MPDAEGFSGKFSAFSSWLNPPIWRKKRCLVNDTRRAAFDLELQEQMEEHRTIDRKQIHDVTGQLWSLWLWAHYPEDVDVPNATAWRNWRSCEDKSVAAGAKWILNTSLRGVALSHPFPVSQPPPPPSSSWFFFVSKDTRWRQMTLGFYGNQSKIKCNK